MAINFVLTFLVFFSVLAGNPSEPANTAFIAVCASLLVMCFLLMAGIGIGELLPRKRGTAKERKLVSLRSGSDIEGTFLFGSGYVGTKRSYLFYELLPSGGFKQDEVPATDTLVFEEERTDGVLKTYRMNFKSWLFWIVAVPSYREEREFHIPKGSVRQEMKL